MLFHEHLGHPFIRMRKVKLHFNFTTNYSIHSARNKFSKFSFIRHAFPFYFTTRYNFAQVTSRPVKVFFFFTNPKFVVRSMWIINYICLIMYREFQSLIWGISNMNIIFIWLYIIHVYIIMKEFKIIVWEYKHIIKFTYEKSLI